jgi:hypothetical protein
VTRLASARRPPINARHVRQRIRDQKVEKQETLDSAMARHVLSYLIR